MDYLSESLHRETDRYILGMMSPPDGVLAKMEEYGLARKFPFVGPLVGQLLEVLTISCGAKRVFELGSGFGYSAIHFARALPEDGRVICTDGSVENASLAARYFTDAGLSHKIDFKTGDAVSLLAETPGQFDIIFMDIDKPGYPDGFRAAWPRLKEGGLFIADNIFWHGKVFGHDEAPATRGIREFTQLAFRTSHAKTTIIPLRDGVSVTLKTA